VRIVVDGAREVHMLGLIVIASDGDGLSPHAQLESLLGAPVLARAIVGALPVDEAVIGVLVVPEDLVERARTEVVERFGLDEIEHIVAGGPDRKSALHAGLAALPSDVEFVLVQDGARPLVPTGLADKIIAAARAGEAAVPAIALRGLVVADEGGLVPLDVRPRLREVQGPQAFRVKSLVAALGDESVGTEAEALAQSGASVALVAGDDDNLLVRDSADMSRAVEVFARRAVDYPFLLPRELVPEDPLARAMDASGPHTLDDVAVTNS
jgi:2-C-methyl-D-erythritol 4-phosphate cytidylyltransferase